MPARTAVEKGQAAGAGDGQFGPATCAALQRTLNDKAKAGLEVDGAFGPLTVTALQRYVKAKADGIVGPETVTEQKKGQILLFDRTAPFTDAHVRWSFSTGNAPGWDHPFEIRFRETQRYGTIALMTFGKPGEGRAGSTGATSPSPGTATTSSPTTPGRAPCWSPTATASTRSTKRPGRPPSPPGCRS
ncbi:peptidoglycan-binding domain-containing protein [Streptomyces sp. NPDC126503]|uniref:peptidoglycan-binding domain-containing protein n=1 Tax=Streptomyces sp. NPDC126503 TaxID=3155315 RepID=UPI0033222C59